MKQRRNPFSQLDLRKFLDRLGIEVTKKGRELVTSCPFPDHDDRHPSWRMREEPGALKHGHWKCFGCARGGGPFSLVRELLLLDIEGVRQWFGGELDASYKPPPPEEISPDTEQLTFVGGFRLPPEVRQEPLARWIAPAQRYVVSRGITEEQVERWSLGYAALGWLRGRVVFPAYSSSGRLQSYAARSFVGSPKRYLAPNPQEGAPSSAIFGAQHWRTFDRVVVCEGAIDALAAERAGAPEVAALFGSQCLPIIVSEMTKFRTVRFAFDPDKAGSAVARALRDGLAGRVRVETIDMPDGLDVNALLLHDPDALQRLIA